ncbi:hypothetical protein [Sporosarcina jiandibaonis]|uniref:hypothetical protein n=1 Tax=Sporosarcina jiandibaonis TaxID=2715535 RepID=UPI001557060D|nr:hypothetical protein [Sporosarcina jiandibaonis]
MLNKFKKYNSNFSIKKIGILLGVLVLTIGLGSGMNNVFAGQDAGSSLINWFEAKKTASEQEISEAIAAVKNRLMDELRIAMQEEKKKAEDELAAFTQEEKKKRTKALEEYADTLKANLKIDNTKEKAGINASLDAIQKEAIEKMDKITAKGNPGPKPGGKVKSTPDSVPVVEPDSTPEPETLTQPKSAPEPEPEPETTPEPESAQ